MWLFPVSGTYCQQREVEAITEGIEDNEGTVYFTQRQRNNQDPRNLNQPLFFEGHFKVKHRLAKWERKEEIWNKVELPSFWNKIKTHKRLKRTL